MKEIVASMTRSLFVACYANAWDAADIPRTLPHAGAGQDWSDHTPESDCSELAALKLALLIEDMNGKPLLPLYNYMADAGKAPVWKLPTKREFGYCLVMQSLGTGVAWSDDHPRGDELKTPLIEAWISYDSRKKTFYMETSGL